MYYVREFKEGFDLVDNTKDFIPHKYLERREYKRRAAFQKNMVFLPIQNQFREKNFIITMNLLVI